MGKLNYVNDNVHGLIRVTTIERMLMSQEIFNRLHNVYQNSAAYFTWPTNRVQRFEHSIGTMKLAGDMFFHSIENADQVIVESFLELIGDSIEGVLCNLKRGDIACIFSDPDAGGLKSASDTWKNYRRLPVYDAEDNPLSDALLPVYDDFLIPSNVSEHQKAICYMTAEAVRVAAMLHDIGHPPFSHAVENALVNLRDEAQGYDKTERVKSFLDAMKRACGQGGNKKLHEAMGDHLVNLLFGRVSDELRQPNTYPNLLNLEFFLIGKMVRKILDDDGVFKSLHAIIDSTVDADRLDFIRRDSMSSGLGAGAVQYNHIIDSMKLVKTNDGSYVFALSLKSANTITAFLKQRYNNYDIIVFHHHVVKTEALLKEVVLALGRQYMLDETEEKDTTETTGRLPSDISGLWAPFSKRTSYGDSFEARVFGQWNDAWLMSMLTGEYISLATKCNDRSSQLNEENTTLLNQLAVLLYGRKGFPSIIKRYEHVLAIDEAFVSRANENIDELLELKASVEIAKKDCSDALFNASAAEELFLSLIPERNANDVSRGQTGDAAITEQEALHASYIIAKNYDVFRLAGDSDPSTMPDLIKNLIEEYSSENNNLIKQVIVVNRSLNAGAQESTYLYDPASSKGCNILTLFGDYSNIRKSIAVEEEMRPQFFAFVQFNENSLVADINIDNKRNEILLHIGHGLFDWYLENFKSFVEQSR